MVAFACVTAVLGPHSFVTATETRRAWIARETQVDEPIIRTPTDLTSLPRRDLASILNILPPLRRLRIFYWLWRCFGHFCFLWLYNNIFSIFRFLAFILSIRGFNLLL
jgi:hypothetical protein